MKKAVLFLLTLSVIVCAFAPALYGCAALDDGKLSVVVTVFSEYDWVMNVLGERAKDVNVTLLIDGNADLHGYTMTAKDKVRILESDVFIYVGGESDKRWVPGVLRDVKKESMKTLCLLDLLGDAAKEEEIVEGMQAEEEEEAAYDEHVWLSLRNAALFVNKIAETLSEADPEYADVYAANAAAYVASLQALDGRYQEMRSAAARDFILVADRFPFRYLADDYDIGYAAAFLGCSAESEVTPKSKKRLIEIVDERDIRVILTTEGALPYQKDARSVRDNSAKKDQEILALDSLQSVGKEGYRKGKTYLSVMESNLEVLRQALA